jgi:hypothetical protein
MAWTRCQAVVIVSAQARSRRFQGPAASAVDEAGDGAQDTVAQRFRLRSCEVAVQGQELQPGQQDAGGHGGVEPGLVQPVVM